MQSPKISIVMPVKNRADTIEKAILSVVDQHYDNVELIILDGGSTDGTVEIIKRYENHISYWHSKYDGSPTIAANEGITKATGDVIALLMADDQYLPGIFNKIAEAYTANPTADIFTCGGRLVRFDSKTNQERVILRFETERSLRLNLYNICFASSAICCRFIKKSLYQRIGLYDVADKNGRHIFSNDKTFLLRAALSNVKDVFIPFVGHHYLSHHESSTFGGNRKNIMRMFDEHMVTAQTFLSSHSLSLMQKLVFIYWYNDQSARLFAYQCLQGEFQQAFTNLSAALKKYTLVWPLSFAVTAIRISASKVLGK